MNEANELEIVVRSVDDLVQPSGAWTHAWREAVGDTSLRAALLRAAYGRGCMVKLSAEISLGRVTR